MTLSRHKVSLCKENYHLLSPCHTLQMTQFYAGQQVSRQSAPNDEKWNPGISHVSIFDGVHPTHHTRNSFLIPSKNQSIYLHGKLLKRTNLRFSLEIILHLKKKKHSIKSRTRTRTSLDASNLRLQVAISSTPVRRQKKKYEIHLPNFTLYDSTKFPNQPLSPYILLKSHLPQTHQAAH